MSAIVTITDGLAVTTTLAIAEGTEVEHKAVIQLTRTYLLDLEEFGRVTFEMRPFETAGGTQKREVAILNEQQSTLLLTYMRNSEIVRAFKKRLVKEFWQMAEQLRGQPAKPAQNPANLSRLQLIEMAMQAEQERLALESKATALEEKVIEQAPKVEALERFAEHDGRFNTRNAAKMLGVPERKLIAWLLMHDWYYRDHSGRLCAKSNKIAQGYLDTVPINIHRSDGIQTVPQPVITQRCLVRLGALLAKDGLIQKQAAGDMFSSVDQGRGRVPPQIGTSGFEGQP